MKETVSNGRKPAVRILSRSVTLVVMMLSLVGCSAAQEMNAHHHSEAPMNPELVQDWAKDRLAKSPRHHEWVKVKHDNREVNCFVVYPEVKNKATAVVVIHEIFGMSDWVQASTDEVAEAGLKAHQHQGGIRALSWSNNYPCSVRFLSKTD